MPLNTFTDLSQGLQDWIEDDDNEFVASIEDVIDLGEKRLLRDIDLAIFRRLDNSATMSVGVATVTKPTITPPDLLIATKNIFLSGGALGGDTFLETRSQEYIRDYNAGGANGTPKYYGEVDEDNWIFGPLPDATYAVNVVFLSRPDPLTAGNQTNWLSDNIYDILFKACLAEAEGFVKSDDRIAIWNEQYIQALPAAKRELYNLYGNQYDHLSAVPVPQAPRSAT